MRRILLPAFAILAAAALSACGTAVPLDRGTEHGATYKGSLLQLSKPERPLTGGLRRPR